MSAIEGELKTLPPPRARRVRGTIDLITARHPRACASMDRRMPTFRRGTAWIAVVNRNHPVSVHTCTHEHTAAFVGAHPHMRTGTGCIDIRDRAAIPADGLGQAVRSALQAHH